MGRVLREKIYMHFFCVASPPSIIKVKLFGILYKSCVASQKSFFALPRSLLNLKSKVKGL